MNIYFYHFFQQQQKNTVLKIIIPAFLLCFDASYSLAQNRQELAEKRASLLTEIKRASKLLSTTKKNKKATLDQFYTLQRQVRQRQELIKTLEEEIELSNQSINRTTNAIVALQTDMERLETEYGAMARQAFRSKMTENELLFIFSAEGLSDGLKRWRYIQQYDDYRKKQAGLILGTRTVLTEKLNSIEIKKASQQDLLASAEQQQILLEEELEQKNTLLKGLKADEARISRLINRKKIAASQLSKTIESIIAAEIKRRTAEERPNTSSTATNSATKSNANLANLTANFKNQKGALPYPIKNGIIIRHFGKQRHPIHKQIQITNNGIDIKATANNKVMAVHGGTVVGVQYVPGFQNTLIVQHGVYYSVYSNLENVMVEKGNVVGKGQLLGYAGENSQSGQIELHLEIWKGKQRLNPAVWLRK